MLTRRLLLIGLLAIVVGSAGCVRNVGVPKLLPKQPEMSLDDLTAKLNAFAAIKTVSAPVTLRFRDLLGASMGKNKEYPAANARLILARPERIRLQVKAPVIGKEVADMVSTGESFRLAIYYPDDKRRFILGSNAGQYKRVESTESMSDPQLKQVGALANMRPQHLTDAFLVQPLTLGADNGVYFLDEVTQVERDDRPGAGKGDEVVRTYYVLTLLEREGTGPEARVTRRFWFDRTRGGTPLVRQEIYESGRLATLIRYMSYLTLEGGVPWPERVHIERVVDQYAVDVIFPRASVEDIEINGEVPDTAFILDNDKKLPETDLDKRAAAGSDKVGSR